MLSFLPPTVRGCILVTLYFLNTAIIFTLIMLVSVFKIVVPVEGWRSLCSRALQRIAAGWVGMNRVNTRLVNKVTWDVEGLEGLEMDQWYLVVSNHQSWTDILVLQSVFYRKIPFLKFFIKKELIWVPLLGLAWWALDFPFMKRYSQAFLKKNPHLAGQDLETTKKACMKFVKTPVSVMNFAEGTRFTPEKHARQESPFQRLLRPKAGGMAFVLSAMNGTLSRMVDVTIAYPHGTKGFWDFMCGRVDLVRVRVRTLPISQELLGDYGGDESFRAGFQDWLNRLWEEKDRELARMMGPVQEPPAR
ncbi:MAG: acyltransferase [Proteobacteria bacterium]|nr:acyltransferase [Pseudomonadota bacterium]